MSIKVNNFLAHLTHFFETNTFPEYKNHFFDYDDDIMVIVVNPEIDKEEFVHKLQESNCFRDGDQITVRSFTI